MKVGNHLAGPYKEPAASHHRFAIGVGSSSDVIVTASLLAGLVSVAVGTELAVVQSAAGELERATAVALGGGTALYLLALTAIHATTGHTGTGVGDRVLWLRLGSAAVALAIGAFGRLGAPLGLVGLLAVLLVAHVAAEMVLQLRAAGDAAPDVAPASGPPPCPDPMTTAS